MEEEEEEDEDDDDDVNKTWNYTSTPSQHASQSSKRTRLPATFYIMYYKPFHCVK
jgi:hypothetical protein